jgi:hypothetical protein
MGNEALVAWFGAVFQNFPRGTEENRGDFKAAGLRTRFEPTGTLPTTAMSAAYHNLHRIISKIIFRLQRISLSAERYGRILSFFSSFILSWR